MAKRKPTARVKTGLRGAPVDSFNAMKHYFHVDVEKKERGEALKTYIKSNYSKKDAALIFQNPDYAFTMHSHFSAVAYWITLKLDVDDQVEKYREGLTEYIKELIEKGKEISERNDVPENVIRFNPHDRLNSKLNATIFEDLYKLEEEWRTDDEATFDMYSSFKNHVLPTSAVSIVLPFIEELMIDYQDAYDKKDDQIVEGYSHLTRKQIKHRLDQYKKMIDDLNRLKVIVKTTRKPRAKKPKAIDKQIARLQYKREDNEFKLASVNPVKIIGASRLYMFNTKTRALTELVSESVNGFEISGTSIKNFNPDLSRSVKLRKPDEFLKIVLGKTQRNISSEWSKLTTKTTAANGRVNADTILLKVF